MGSQNLTKDGQRKKLFVPRGNTLAKKSDELVRLCQSDVYLCIRPYGEKRLLVYQSRPNFPVADNHIPSVGWQDVELKQPADELSNPPPLLAVLPSVSTETSQGNTHHPSPFPSQSSYIDPTLCEQVVRLDSPAVDINPSVPTEATPTTKLKSPPVTPTTKLNSQPVTPLFPRHRRDRKDNRTRPGARRREARSSTANLRPINAGIRRPVA